LLLSLPAHRLRATEAIAILLPLLMLVAAALTGWLVTDRLMLRPLRQLREAVLAYRAGTSGSAIPHLSTPANEIRDLADAFRGVTETIVRHEGELEEGLSRQTRLTREVHHRVKNNLQVVASLLNLHARGATLPDVRDAYASIQRRVDALAVVHRNHYAELEENRGVALRPLIGELAANLRASAPPAAQSMRLLLDLASVYATQDVAVPVAFLITELVEAAMIRQPRGTVAISLSPTGGDRALLTVEAAALAGPAIDGDVTSERVERVILGLSRQLRSALQRDETGKIGIEIAIIGRG
jgi:two-component system, sensor histidine kinase PdtaS